MIRHFRRLSTMVPLVLDVHQCARLPGPSVVPIDVSWHMPGSKRDPLADFRNIRLPRARFLNLDEVANHDHPMKLPHMMPSASDFARACGALGITRQSHVVLYDSVGVFSSPRALFMFKAFGHENASILNGGLPAWQSHGYPLEEGSRSTTNILPTEYPENEVTLDEGMIRSYDDVVKNMSLSPFNNTESELVLDARSAERFNGTAPEPRPGLKSGHIPNSFSLPFSTLLEAHQTEDKTGYTTLRAPEDLRKIILESISVDGTVPPGGLARRFVNTCGSGMTAAIIWLALQQIGVNSSIYDESWMGYAERPASKIAVVESGQQSNFVE